MSDKMFTPEEVARRAKQAIKEGVTLSYDGEGTITIRNTTKGTEYAIDAKTGKCSCPAWGACKHQALVIFDREKRAGRGKVIQQEMGCSIEPAYDWWVEEAQAWTGTQTTGIR